MTTTQNRFRAVATSLALATALAAAGGSAALAQAALVDTPQVQPAFARSASAAINGFDWHAKPERAQKIRYAVPPARVAQQIGYGSYICSPAGFGRKSRCYSN
jgi:hypothetical protein